MAKGKGRVAVLKLKTVEEFPLNVGGSVSIPFVRKNPRDQAASGSRELRETNEGQNPPDGLQ